MTNYYIPDLTFKQVMSFFQLDLTNIPNGEQITEIEFEASEELFISSASIDLTSAEIISGTKTMSSAITATVEDHTGSTAAINFAVLPVDLSGKSITLSLTTKTESGKKVYTKEFSSGLNFERNSFLHSSSGSLSLIEDFLSVDGDSFKLSDFSSSFIPNGDTWVITDKTATTADFDGLKQALKSSNRNISLEFVSLTSLPSESFKECKNLYYISCPNVTTVGLDAFTNCSNLSIVSFPRVTLLDEFAFSFCEKLTSVYFPEVVTIAAGAFTNCLNLISAEFPKATTIQDENGWTYGGAFYNCEKLTDISFPKLVYIGSKAFLFCKSLTNVSFPNVEMAGDLSFSSSGVKFVSFPELITTGERFLSDSLVETISESDFPKLETIEEGFFFGCEQLISVHFPKAKTIKTLAFSQCVKLSTVLLPKLTRIESTNSSSNGATFYGCTSLVNISLPSVQYVGINAFEECTDLKFVDLPSATTIENKVFFKCSSLQELRIAIKEGLVIQNLGLEIFNISDNISHSSNIVLTIGVSNIFLIGEKTLTCDAVSYTFKNINITGGIDSNVVANLENASSIGW